MKSLELKLEDLPMTVKLKTQDGTKVYLLLGTRPLLDLSRDLKQRVLEAVLVEYERKCDAV